MATPQFGKIVVFAQFQESADFWPDMSGRRISDSIIRQVDASIEDFAGRWDSTECDDGSTAGPATMNRVLTTLKLPRHHAETCGHAVTNPTRGVAFL